MTAAGALRRLLVDVQALSRGVTSDGLDPGDVSPFALNYLERLALDGLAGEAVPPRDGKLLCDSCGYLWGSPTVNGLKCGVRLSGDKWCDGTIRWVVPTEEGQP